MIGLAPGIRPGFQFLSAGTPWTPAQIGSALSGWYDASDASTITQSSGAVSAWGDKSVSSGARTGSPNNLTQSNASNRPTYASTGFPSDNGPKIAIASASTQYMAFGSAVSYSGGSGLSVFATVEQNTTNTAKTIIGPAAAGGIVARWNGSQAGNGTLQLVRSNQAGLLSTASASATTGAHLINVLVSSALQYLAIDATSASSATDPAFTSGFSYIGTDGGSSPFDGSIRELVVVTGVVSTSVRQKLEGYLAWKSGLQTNLPSGHPYKSRAPYVSDP